MKTVATETEEAIAENPVIQKDSGKPKQQRRGTDYGYETEENTTETSSAGDAEGVKESKTGSKVVRSKVSFGNVNVHKHRMTLGTNPSAKNGIPVELAWDVLSCEELAVDEFEKRHGEKNLQKLDADKRQEIAEVNHSRGSIVRTQEEVKGAQARIFLSKREDPDNPIVAPAATSCCTII